MSQSDLLLSFSCSAVSDSFQPRGLWPHQTSLSMGLSRREYWSGLPFPIPEDLHGPGIKPGSPALTANFFTTEPPGGI